jgi:hypothetical protein
MAPRATAETRKPHRQRLESNSVGTHTRDEEGLAEENQSKYRNNTNGWADLESRSLLFAAGQVSGSYIPLLMATASLTCQ